MQKLFVVLVAAAALSACGARQEPEAIVLKDWTPPETTTSVPDALPLADTDPVETTALTRPATSNLDGGRETVAGVRISVERTVTDLGKGSQEYFDYEARYRGGYGGVLVPVGWEPDVEGIDTLAWSGDGTVMLYAIETGPGVVEVIVSGPNVGIVDRVETTPGAVVPVASTYSLAQTVIEGRDVDGATLGTCKVSETYSSLVSCG